MVSRLGNEFKETELGWIPKEWNISELENLTIKITDGAHHSPPTFERGYPIATVENMEYSSIDVTACRTISGEDFELLKRNSCSPEYGDVLFSKDGTIGKTFVYKQWDEIVLLSSIAIIRTNKAVLLPQYLTFFLQSPYFYWNLERLRSGSAIKRIVLKDIKRVLLPIPSLKEQQKIASILSSVDEAIGKIKAIIEKTEKVKKGLMQQLLTKGVGHTKFKKTEFGEIPEEWEIQNVEFISNKITDGEHITPVYRDKGKYLLSAKDVLVDKLNFEQSKFVDEKDFEKFTTKCKPEYGDILMVSRGATIGRTHLVKTNEEFCLMGSVILVKPKHEMVNNSFLRYFLQSNYAQRELYRISGSSAQQAIYLSGLKKFKIPLPSMQEQKQIARTLEGIERKVFNERANIIQLNLIKKGLMQSLLTGKVRVKVDESEVTQV
ncbi:restriction endonuclease subunit S [Bacillus mycoides]|uniref:restriction endonuclease subunit S n=1 Tax=Bacillus mycoides TaxID=1405 RepID=UPI001C5E9D31|nr:restriction endonuclease subunit S [Bacillus mycoides]